MTGKFGVLILAGIALFAGAIWWFSSGTDQAVDQLTREAEENTRAPQDAPDSETEPLPTGQGTMLDLFERGDSMECQFTFSDDEGTSGEGTGFFDDGRMRVDTVVQTEGETIQSSYIYDEPQMYTWGNTAEGEFAVMMETDPEEFAADTSADEEAPVGVDDNVTYDCQTWNVDGSVFVPPASIEFTDMGAMMQGVQGMEGMEDMDPEELEAMMQQMQ